MSNGVTKGDFLRFRKEHVIVIPELEKQRKVVVNWWTDADIAILKEYYGKVPIRALKEALNRTRASIDHKARELDLTHPRV
jgi:hypothetical protein